ncbi:hypothetical protein QAD02_022717 [Eretmocerus hayati]|uniref:Uncharacterized protein n=1 Tax=Eretmocerus hayati TaxID=131215 RepID=A0ACC2PVE3_9HYME|nr:hypothetical protein QAD02_022717 [Eretmocerus hayati]
MTNEDHADYPEHIERDNSPVLGPYNLAEKRPPPPANEAFQEEEGHPAHEARFDSSATITRPPQEPVTWTALMKIERVRSQPNQPANVLSPPLTLPPSAVATQQQRSGELPRSPTIPPPNNATEDRREPVWFLRRPHELPPVRDNGASGTTALLRPFPALPHTRLFETPATEQPQVQLVPPSTLTPPPAAVAPWPAPRAALTTTSTASTAAPQTTTATATVNSSVPDSVTMPILDSALLITAMTPADHEQFQALVVVAVTMPRVVQEQMYAAFFDEICGLS